MNIQLDKRLGRIWLEVEKHLSMEETNNFRNAAVKAKNFDDLPKVYKDLVLEIESSAEESDA